MVMVIYLFYNRVFKLEQATSVRLNTVHHNMGQLKYQRINMVSLALKARRASVSSYNNNRVFKLE